MEKLLFNVVFDYQFDYSGESDFEIPFDSEMLNKFKAKAEECEENDIDFTEDILADELPEIAEYIENYAEEHVWELIDLLEGQTQDDFTWYIEYPEDMRIFFF